WSEIHRLPPVEPCVSSRIVWYLGFGIGLAMRAGMRCCLVLLAVSAVILVAAPAGAQTYSLVSPDGTVYFTNLPTRAYARDINEAAVRYAVPERLIWAVIRAESGFEPRAVSRRGARGLMQLM